MQRLQPAASLRQRNEYPRMRGLRGVEALEPRAMLAADVGFVSESSTDVFESPGDGEWPVFDLTSVDLQIMVCFSVPDVSPPVELDMTMESGEPSIDEALSDCDAGQDEFSRSLSLSEHVVQDEDLASLAFASADAQTSAAPAAAFATRFSNGDALFARLAASFAGMTSYGSDGGAEPQPLGGRRRLPIASDAAGYGWGMSPRNSA